MRRFALYFLTAASAVTATCAMIRPAAAEEPAAALVVANFKVVDVDITGCRKLGFDFRAAPGSANASAMADHARKSFDAISSADKKASCFVMPKNSAWHAMIDVLCKDQLATVITSPTLTMAVGQRGEFHAGEKLRMPEDKEGQAASGPRIGTDIDFVAKKQDDGRALITFHVRCSDIDESRQVEVGKMKVPAFRTFEAGTTDEVKWGDTFVMRHPRPPKKQVRGAPHDMVRLVLVMPTLEGAPAVASKPERPLLTEAEAEGRVFPQPVPLRR